MKDISKEMFVAWKHDPVTIAVIDALKTKRDQVKEAWANSAFKEDRDLREAVGYCIGLREFEMIEFSEETKDANESDSVASAG